MVKLWIDFSILFVQRRVDWSVRPRWKHRRPCSYVVLDGAAVYGER